LRSIERRAKLGCILFGGAAAIGYDYDAEVFNLGMALDPNYE
jgi:hypothetical protein